MGEDTPEGEWLQTWLEGEDRPSVSMMRRFPDSDEMIWSAPDGRDTITHHTYAAPSHWFKAAAPAKPEGV